MKERPSERQLEMLLVIMAGLPYSFREGRHNPMKKRSGITVTRLTMQAIGWLDENNQVTPAGRAAAIEEKARQDARKAKRETFKFRRDHKAMMLRRLTGVKTYTRKQFARSAIETAGLSDVRHELRRVPQKTRNGTTGYVFKPVFFPDTDEDVIAIREQGFEAERFDPET